MSWHYSQALVAEYSAASSADSAPCAQSNGTPMHGTFWSPDKTTDASKPSRSGMTFRPSTDAHGGALLTWCLAASRAKTSQRLARAPESKVSEAECGSTWRESSVRFCRNSSSWKTHLCLWEEGLDWSSVTWPKWGMMRDGVLWEGQASEPPHFENAYGLWPTPCAAGGETGGPVGLGGGTAARMKLLELCETEEEARALGCGKTNPAFAEWLLAWPINWTSIEPNDSGQSAMDKYQEWLRWHGKF